VSLSLLFLCGGRRVGLLEAFRQALRDRGGGRLYTTDTEARAASSFVADRCFTVAPCRNARDFALDVAQLCEQEQVSAVLPLRCDAVAAIPELRHRTSSRIIGGDDDAIRICGDKLLTACHFRATGVTTPEVVECPSAADLPLFCRPRLGEGSKGVQAIFTRQQLDCAPRDGSVFTRFVQGTEYTFDCYKSLSGELISIVPRQRLRVRAGEVERSITRRADDLASRASAVLEPLRFVGPATVQAIVSDSEIHFTEINLRYGGGVTLSIAAGADSPRWLVAELRGETPACGPVRWNLGMSRYDAEFYYQDDSGDHTWPSTRF
jgi:carbamoyl-phosphate synthase large subunit